MVRHRESVQWRTGRLWDSSFSGSPRDLAAIADGEQIEEVAQGRDERGDVGERGGVQDLVHAQNFLARSPWYAVFPGGAIALAVLGFNLLGDGLRDLVDPRVS